MPSDKSLIWVVILNSNDCRIYSYYKDSESVKLKLTKEISHPENKLRDIDLTSDKPGRYQAGDSAHGAFSQPSDPKEIKIDHLSNEIAKELEHGRTTNAYGKLIVIALPHMYGLLLQHINKHVKDLIIHNIEKDAFHMNDRELLDFLHSHLSKR